MAAATPRRSTRIPHMHTPLMSERKKGLFVENMQVSSESLTKHRRLPVVNSESDSDDCDLGIISTLNSSSSDENDVNKTPERNSWRETRSHTRNLLKESHDLKNFMKSPFTLSKFQTRYSSDAKCTSSRSTPSTPHLPYHPGTPSSSHSCASVNTTSSTTSKARKSLASLIADTESCSSSLKDLNFDTDSDSDSKENSPMKATRRSSRTMKLTPKMQSFKGVLLEQKKNLTSPMNGAITPVRNEFVSLTKMDISNFISPTQILKTPQSTTDTNMSPPKINHNKKNAIEIQESPGTNDSDKAFKRIRNDSLTDPGPNSKHPRLETNVSRARLSLFNSDRLKDILSAKSFYGKSNPELNSTVTNTLSKAIEVTNTHHCKTLSHSHSHKRRKRPGQINMGVRHKIKKPKINRSQSLNIKGNSHINKSSNTLNSSANTNMNVSCASQNTSQEMDDKADPFDKENQVIADLLSQWTEEEVPESELPTKPPELPCFNSTIMAETSQIFQPISAVPVTAELPEDNNSVIVEIGTDQGEKSVLLQEMVPNKVKDDVRSGIPGEVAIDGAQYLSVEGGYIIVDETKEPVQEMLPDLDEIDRELQMLDEQILQLARSNNIDPRPALAACAPPPCLPKDNDILTAENPQPPEINEEDKLFSIFTKPNHGITTSVANKDGDKGAKHILKSGIGQYVIDAGQKKFGATQCTECGVIYEIGDPQDEHDHLIHHNATDILKFKGLRMEQVVGRSGSGRCVQVRGAGAGWRRVPRLLDALLHPLLNAAPLPTERPEVLRYTAYLYIEKSQIIGCLVMEPKSRANKYLPGDPDCCTIEEFPVKVGVCRVWTHGGFRRRGVAGRLLDCARASFLYGTSVTKEEVAFSAPTAAGKAFATKYTGTENFYVYIE